MNDDLISRQAGIDAFVKYVADGYAESPDDYDGYMEIIKSLPTAEPKKGKWVILDDKHYDVSKCSECGVVEYFNKGWKRFNFCPNCGARMEES